MEDWVKARKACTPFELFVQLRAGAERDVAARNELRDPDEQVGFKVLPRDESFSVLRQGNKISASVDFHVSKTGITVRNGDGETFLEGSVTLDDDGSCLLGIASEPKPLTCAQFRRRALEDLLFRF